MVGISYRLQIQSGEGVGREHDLSAQTITIGRYPLADVVIDDADVSYRHAVLTHGGETYRIADLGSDAGTYVNGRRVGAEPVALSPGDIILLGSRVSAAFLAITDEPNDPIEEEISPATTALSDVEPPAVAESVAESAAAENEYDAPVGDAESVVETPATPQSRQPLHAGPLPAMPPPRKSRNGRIILIAAGCLVLLTCCCSATLFMYFVGGDWLLNQLGYLP